MTVINEQPASRKPRIAQQNGVVAVGDGALEPVIQSALIQSALGIVRESADLLCHIAGFGVALVSGPKISRPKRGIKQTRSAAPKSANVILFPQLETSSHRPKLNRNKS